MTKAFSFSIGEGWIPFGAVCIVQMQYKHEEECLFRENRCCEQA